MFYTGATRVGPDMIRSRDVPSHRNQRPGRRGTRVSQAGSQAWAFYREVAATRVVWTIRDDGGFPAPLNHSGERAQPFWSPRSRVEWIIKNVPAYSRFSPYEISWDDFRSRWASGLTNDGVLVGVNWSGQRAVGYDVGPEELVRCVQAVIENPQ
jgi:hypothetical protein